MATADFPARGTVVETRSNVVVFQPVGTNYQMHLLAEGAALEAGAAPVDALVRVSARKVMSVPSGGNWVQPIFGPPRIIQGRVRWLDERQLVVQAGCPVIVDLPPEATALDLNSGPITVGTMVNVTALPGATFAALEPAAR